MASTGSLPVPWQAYYGFPYFSPQADPAEAEKPKPTNTLEVLKLNEEAVEKILNDMPKIQKLIIYRTLNAEGVRMEGIDRAIVKEAQEQLKAIKAAP